MPLYIPAGAGKYLIDTNDNINGTGVAWPTTPEGEANIAIGVGALPDLYAAGFSSENIAIGAASLAAFQDGNRNIALGYLSNSRSPENNDTIAIGHDALWADESAGINTIAIGNRSGRMVDCEGTIAIGELALGGTGPASGNLQCIALGYSTGTDSGDGVPMVQCTGMILIGPYAGGANNSSHRIIAIGEKAAEFNSLSLDCIYLGTEAGAITTESENAIFIGTRAGAESSGSTNPICIGTEAGALAGNTSGAVIIGAEAGHTGGDLSASVVIGAEAGKEASAQNSIMIGPRAGEMVSGGTNIFVGHLSGNNATNCDGLISIGNSALFEGSTFTSTTKSIFIGDESGSALNSSYCVAIGHSNSSFNNSINCAKIGSLVALASSPSNSYDSQWVGGGNVVVEVESDTEHPFYFLGGFGSDNTTCMVNAVGAGENRPMDDVTLVAGTVTVLNSLARQNSKIFLTNCAPAGTVGFPYVSAIVDGVGFTITSTEAGDTSTLTYEIKMGVFISPYGI